MGFSSTMGGTQRRYGLTKRLGSQLFFGLLDSFFLGHVELLHVLLDDGVERLLVDDAHHGEAISGIW